MTIDCELGQVRKEAAVAVVLGVMYRFAVAVQVICYADLFSRLSCLITACSVILCGLASLYSGASVGFEN